MSAFNPSKQGSDKLNTNLITRWKLDPSYPNPFSPVAKALKFSAVSGTIRSKDIEEEE